MSHFKKILLTTLMISLFSGLFFLAPSFAKDYGLETTRAAADLSKTVAGQTDVFGVGGKIISAALSLVGIVFFALVLFAGLMWMTARGDSARVDKAKTILETSAIGLVIVMGAYAIVNFVFIELLTK